MFTKVIKPQDIPNLFRLIWLWARIPRIATILEPSKVLERELDQVLNSNNTLGELFAKYKSDKSTVHNYDKVYEGYLETCKNKAGIVVEIGIGTNNPSIPSFMSKEYRPGASLRAFAEYLPRMQVIGGDIDKQILFQDDRIRTYFVNQKKKSTFSEITNAITTIKIPVRLIVIDGLHQPIADINSIIMLLPYLSEGGHLYVEDVFPSKQNYFIWGLALKLLNANRYEGNILQREHRWLIQIKRKH
jgi:hypothetical protein